MSMVKTELIKGVIDEESDEDLLQKLHRFYWQHDNGKFQVIDIKYFDNMFPLILCIITYKE